MQPVKVVEAQQRTQRVLPLKAHRHKVLRIVREQYRRHISQLIPILPKHVILIDSYLIAEFLPLWQIVLTQTSFSHTFIVCDSSRINIKNTKPHRIHTTLLQIAQHPTKPILFVPDLFLIEIPVSHQSEYMQISLLRDAILHNFPQTSLQLVLNSNSDVTEYTDIQKFVSSIEQLHSAIPQIFDSLNQALQMREQILLSDDVARSSVGYKEYLASEQVQQLLVEKKAFRGFFRVRRFNPRNAVVEIAADCDFLDNNREIVILNRFDRNRAVEGDEVIVQLLPKNRWKNFADALASESDDLAESKQMKEDDNDDAVGDLTSSKFGTVKPCGEIVHIVSRNLRNYVATLSDLEADESAKERLLVVPLDKRIPKIRIRTRQSKELVGKRLVVAIDSWSLDSRYPDGHYLYALGDIGSLDAETQALLLEHEIKHFPYSGINVLPFSPELPDEKEWNEVYPSQKIPQNRSDIRKTHLVMSIDPPGCRDIDDALSVRKISKNCLEFGVHIADVSYFIHHNSPLDLEARSRATTVYLVDRHLNMIPEIFSENVCSLHQNVDRFAMSVFWEVDPTDSYKVKKHWFSRTIIRSKYALAYEEAQNIFDGNKSILPSSRHAAFEECRDSISMLVLFARHLRKKRAEEGSLELDSIEALFEINREAEDPELLVADVRQGKDLELHHTVAELMIFANMTVAEFLFSKFPTCSLLRYHPPPQKHKLLDLLEILESKGYFLDLTSGYTLSKSLNEIKKLTQSDAYILNIIKSLLTRAMSEAKYFSTGALPQAEFSHFGLAGQFYTHFTSPIRRYADVIVHRLLLAALDGSSPPFENSHLEKLCAHLNQRNRSAKAAQRDSKDIFLSLYLKNQQKVRNDVPELAEAFIFDIRSNGLLVHIPKYQYKDCLVLQDSGGKLIAVSDNIPNCNSEECAIEKEGRVSLTLTIPSLKVNHTFRIFQKLLVSVKTSSTSNSKYRLACCTISLELFLDPLLTTLSKQARNKLKESIRSRVGTTMLNLNSQVTETVEEAKSEKMISSSHTDSLYKLLNAWNAKSIRVPTEKKGTTRERVQKGSRIAFIGRKA